MASQLRPITLLGPDYKLLIKMIAARLLYLSCPLCSTPISCAQYKGSQFMVGQPPFCQQLSFYTSTIFREVKSAKIFKKLTGLRGCNQTSLGTLFADAAVFWFQPPGCGCLYCSLLHDLLEVRAARHHLRLEDTLIQCCLRCPPPDPRRPYSISTPRVRGFLLRAFPLFQGHTLTLRSHLSEETHLKLAWPPSLASAKAAVTLAVTTFSSWAWATCDCPDILIPAELQTKLRQLPLTPPFAASSSHPFHLGHSQRRTWRSY
jgi:hypothetical protein